MCTVVTKEQVGMIQNSTDGKHSTTTNKAKNLTCSHRKPVCPFKTVSFGPPLLTAITGTFRNIACAGCGCGCWQD